MRATSKPAPDITSAARQVNTDSTLLHTVLWVAEKCESHHDFEQFHTLLMSVAPKMGVMLEQAVVDLRCVDTGLFDPTTEARHA